MRYSAISLALSTLPILSYAAPIRRTLDPADILVFQFANVLEQLETQFYMQALSKFTATDFLNAGFSSAEVAIEQIMSIAVDEATHTTALQAALTGFGVQPVTTCVFNFDSVLTSVEAMLPVARLVELVGVGAYLGAAHLLTDPRLLTSAGSILTSEARHQSLLNILNGGTAIPQAFDIPLSPSQVLGIAGPFISGCDLGVPANAPLSITTSGAIGPGTALAFDSPALQGLDTSTLFCNMIVGGAREAISLPFSQCIVPMGIDGPVAISILNDSQPLLASDIVDQSALTTVAGPTIAFIDFSVAEQTLSQLVLTPSSPLNKNVGGIAAMASMCGGVPCMSSTVSTISPGQASGIASAAAATGTSGSIVGTDGVPVATDSAGQPVATGTPDASGGGATSVGAIAQVGAPTDPTTDSGASTAGTPTDPTTDSGAASVGAPTDPTTDSGAASVGAPTDPTTASGVASVGAPTDPTADAASSSVSADSTTPTVAPASFSVTGGSQSGDSTPADNGDITVLGWD